MRTGQKKKKKRVKVIRVIEREKNISDNIYTRVYPLRRYFHTVYANLIIIIMRTILL